MQWFVSKDFQKKLRRRKSYLLAWTTGAALALTMRAAFTLAETRPEAAQFLAPSLAAARTVRCIMAFFGFVETLEKVWGKGQCEGRIWVRGMTVCGHCTRQHAVSDGRIGTENLNSDHTTVTPNTKDNRRSPTKHKKLSVMSLWHLRLDHGKEGRQRANQFYTNGCSPSGENVSK